VRRIALAREAERLTASLDEELKAAIRSVPDYPKKGVVFRDLTTLWKNGPLTKKTIDALHEHFAGKKLDAVVGIEARGFIVGAPLADRLDIGFVPARKAGKLPFRKMGKSYDLEYGSQGLEIHLDAISGGERVVIVDDLLATGGTASAARGLVEQLGGVVAGFAFVAELTFLKGRDKLSGPEVFSLVKYDAE